MVRDKTMLIIYISVKFMYSSLHINCGKWPPCVLHHAGVYCNTGSVLSAIQFKLSVWLYYRQDTVFKIINDFQNISHGIMVLIFNNEILVREFIRASRLKQDMQIM